MVLSRAMIDLVQPRTNEADRSLLFVDYCCLIVCALRLTFRIREIDLYSLIRRLDCEFTNDQIIGLHIFAETHFVAQWQIEVNCRAERD